MVSSWLRGYLVFLSIAMCGPGRAEDSVLGLPTPRDPRRPGAVMLHGGGRITDDAFSHFVELAGGRDARILLVPSAGYRLADHDSPQQFRKALERRFSSWVRLASTGRVKQFDFLATDDPADADKLAFVRPLTVATGVWFCGGAQSRLNYRYVGDFPRPTRFQEALREVLARGGVVGGTSAGMAALPEIMTLHEGDRDAGGPHRVVAAHGLGLFHGAIVEQHFDNRSGRLERFTGLLRSSARLDRLAEHRGAGARMLGLAVESSTALILQADGLETLGRGNAHVFLKTAKGQTITWHTLGSGEKLVLKCDENGEVVVSRP